MLYFDEPTIIYLEDSLGNICAVSLIEKGQGWEVEYREKYPMTGVHHVLFMPGRLEAEREFANMLEIVYERGFSTGWGLSHAA